MKRFVEGVDRNQATFVNGGAKRDHRGGVRRDLSFLKT